MRTLHSRFNGDIEVSLAHRRIFLYVASAPAAGQVKQVEQVEQVVRNVLVGHDVAADVWCDRWNPISKSWTSHKELMNAERRESAATGLAAWQARVGPSSHRKLKSLARRLEADGFPVTRRWMYLFTGANCEDDTRALADRIRGYTSTRMRISVQRVYDRLPPVWHGIELGWYQPDGEWHPA
jgi:hypothetical protein